MNSNDPQNPLPSFSDDQDNDPDSLPSIAEGGGSEECSEKSPERDRNELPDDGEKAVSQTKSSLPLENPGGGEAAAASRSDDRGRSRRRRRKSADGSQTSESQEDAASASSGTRSSLPEDDNERENPDKAFAGERSSSGDQGSSHGRPGGGPQETSGSGENDGSAPVRSSGSENKGSRRKGRRDGSREENSRHSDQGRSGRDDGEEDGSRRRRKKRNEVELTGPFHEVGGLFELSPKGFGFLRTQKNGFKVTPGDVFVTPELVRKYGLRQGHWIMADVAEGSRGPQVAAIKEVNGGAPESVRNLPYFEELKAINPNKRIILETNPNRFTTRIIDIIAPVGKGQRGLIVAPPRTGKTTLLQHIAEAVVEKYEDMHLMLLLVDERPEEVTEFSRSLPTAEVYASSNDNDVKNHTRVAELCIDRAKRLVEAGQDVFILLDSITRLGRAFNSSNRKGKGRTMSGGIDARALEIPRRIFAAARNTRGGGALTILGTALIETGSKADDLIFQEFKGTGNMELMLDRRISQQYIYPAVDIFKSGTRREELLLPPHQLAKIHVIRRGLSGHKPDEAIQRLLSFCERFPNNNQMLIEIPGA